MATFLRSLMLTADQETLAETLPRHEAQLAAWRAEGRLILEFATKSGDVRYELFHAEDRMEADRLARESPFVELGLCSWTVKEVEPSGDSRFSAFASS